MAAPSRAQWKSFWMGLQSWTQEQGSFPSMAEVRQSQTSVFARRLTIGPADQDSDDVISTLSMGDWSGGGQVEEMTGADQTRYWWGVFDGRSPRQASLPPLVTNPNSGKPSGATGTSYPLGVVNDTAYFAFGTDIAGFNEATDEWYTKESMTNAPVGKCIEFNGSLYVPTGTNGYSVITESATGNPVTTLVTGAADPTAAPATPVTVGPNPRVAHFCVAEGRKLFALTVTGGICYSLTGAASSWVWDYNSGDAAYPKIETQAVPRRLIPFFNREGKPAIFATTSRGALIYDRSNAVFLETPIQYPQHPDVGYAATVWRPGEDLWIGTGLDTVRFTSSNVAIPLSGVSRDAGVPSNYRGAIKDLEPELSTLFALVGGVSDTYEALAYAAKLSGGGSGDGQWDEIHGVWVDSTGSLFAADTNNERVQELSTTPAYVAKWGSSGTGNGQFSANNGAYDGACDASDNHYVVDRGNSRVQKFTNTGTYSAQFGSFDDGTEAVAGTEEWTLNNTFGSTGTGNTNFDTPAQVATDDSDNIYIADTANNRLIKRDNDGAFVSAITSLTGITAVDVDPSGNVYVGYTDTLRKYNSSHVSQWSISLSGIAHLTTDGTHVYATLSNHLVRKYLCTDGSFVDTWGNESVGSVWTLQATYGSTGTGNDNFDTPCQITVDASGNTYTADRENGRVVQRNSSGAFVAAAAVIDKDGIPVDPVGISRDSSGRFLISDNHGSVSHFASWAALVAGTATGAGSVVGAKHITTDNTHFYYASAVSWDRVVKIPCDLSSGQVTWGSAGSGNGQFSGAYGIAYSSVDNLLYVVEQGNSRVQVFSTAGVYQRQFPISANARGCAIDASGDVLVAEYGSDVVKRYTSSGTLIDSFAQDNPDGIAVVTGDVVWVSNADTDNLAKWDEVATSSGSSSSSNGEFNTPKGIVISGSSVYVVDQGNSRVQELNTSGVYQRQWAIPAGCRGIDVNSSGQVLVANFSNDLINRYTSTGSLVDTFSQADPHGIAVDSNDIVWVSNATSDNLTEWEYVITPPVAAAPPANGKFNLPEGISINRTSGRIYVADTANHRVEYFTSAHAYEGKFGSSDYSLVTGAITAGSGNGQFNTPTSIAVNQSTGNVYVVDQGNDRVQYFSATGSFLGKWGTTGTGQGQFMVPTVLAIHPFTGNVVVGDSTRDDFQEFTSTGEFIRNFGATGSGDGQFNTLTGITYAADGDAIYVADATNDRVTRINASTVTEAINAVPHLQGWTGIGWQGLWEGDSNTNVPTWAEVMSVTGGYNLWWGSTDGLAYRMKLRRTLHNPRQGVIAGVDTFAATGYVETANADMGMLGFTKIASHVIVFMRSASATEKITVEYAIDDGGWTTLGEVTEAGRTVLPFNQSLITDTETVSRGISFNWIKFRLNFARGADDTQTPVIRAFNLHFLKVPQNSSSFQFTVPLPKRSWKGRGARDLSDALIALLESHEMVFLRHQDRIYRGRLAQVTGVDATGRDFSGIRNVNFIEIQEDGGS